MWSMKKGVSFLSVALLAALVSLPSYAGGMSKLNVPYSALQELAVTEPDATIEYGKDPLQVIYQYGELSEAKRAVVFIHGGCWLNAYDIKHSVGWMTHLAAEGLTVFGIEYRRTGDQGGGWPGSRDDIVTALDTLHTRFTNERYPEKVFLAGHSAGGHLALLASEDTDLQLDKVIGLAAITDVKLYSQGTNSCQQATPAFMGGTPMERPSAYQSAQPKVSKQSGQTLLMQGTADAIVPAVHAELAGSQKIIVEGAGHFDWLHPQSQAFNEFYEQVKQ